MSQRELTNPERLTLEIAIQQLKRQRRRRKLCPAWFEIDSALALSHHLRLMEFEVDAYCLCVLTTLLESGKSEEVMAALNRILCGKQAVKLVPMDACGIMN